MNKMLSRYSIFPCERKEIRGFIENWHYSGSINGVKDSYCFKLMENKFVGGFRNTRIIGAALFGRLAMANAFSQYVENEDKIIELRRLCCIDDTPKNTESYFISRCLRWLKKNTDLECVVSYADENYDHVGGIYKATNFDYRGNTQPSKMIEFDGKLWHDKTIRTKYNGKLKPYARKLKNALDEGAAKYVDTKFKHIFTYNLDERRKTSVNSKRKRTPS